MIKKEDLRVLKTNKALISAFFIILNKQSFKKISVNEICEAALISRAAFYQHFNSKYDLLQHWLRIIGGDITGGISCFSKDDVIAAVNRFVTEYRRIIKNLIDDPDELVLDLLEEFIVSAVDTVFVNSSVKSANKRLSRFCAGGILSLLKVHVREKNPPNNEFMSAELYDLLSCIETHSTDCK